MLKAKDFRKRAWDHLGGEWLGNVWGTFAVIALLYVVVNSVGGAMSVALIGLAVMIFVSGPLELGMAIVSTNVVRSERIEVEDAFGGFRDNMTTAIILWLLNNIFIFLWSLLLVIPGIVKSYSYSMSFFILRDNPTMNQNEARRRSMEMMKGNKWRLFCLDFSFIGWIILCGLTFGILSFWIIPYMMTARAEFYQSLLGEAVPYTENTEPPADPFENTETV